MTTDLVALAPHESYTASDTVIIGDGTDLAISNVGSFNLTSLPTPLLFTNVLHVLVKSTNLIFVTPRPDEVHSTYNCKGAYVH